MLKNKKGQVYRFIVDGQKADYAITFNGLFHGENKIMILGLSPNNTPTQTMLLAPDQMEQVENIKEV